MARTYLKVKADATPSERAIEVMAAEVKRPGTTLFRLDWLTCGAIEKKLRGKMRGTVLPGEVETALDHLETLGLVQYRYRDPGDGLPRGMVQCYRWSRYATAEVLGWRVAAVRPVCCSACGGPIPESLKRRETCSLACRKKSHNERGSQYRKARAMGAA